VRAAVVVVWLAAGCRQLLGLHDLPMDDAVDAPAPGDAPGESMQLVDGPAGADGADGAAPGDTSGQLCLGTGSFNYCVPAPTMPFAVSANTTLDTATDPRCNLVGGSGRPVACVIAGTMITLQAGTLFATGPNPLVLLSASTLDLSGTIDIGSHRDGQALGAGADPSLCATGSAGGSNANGGAGGAGGSLGSHGGNGGSGHDQTAGGTSPQQLAGPSTVLRGGCPGGAGGDGGAANTGGAAGAGGGAVLLLAASSITISGIVDAAGSGGGGAGSPRGGGGGGGSGGMIVLDAPALTVAGTLDANGGGGGGGAAGAVAGQDGSDPDLGHPSQPAPGGQAGVSTSGNGGIGSSGPGNAGSGGNGATMGGDAGGGGGGGGGQIRVLQGNIPNGPSISPPPSN
jgi:hypothetical protein